MTVLTLPPTPMEMRSEAHERALRGLLEEAEKGLGMAQAALADRGLAGSALCNAGSKLEALETRIKNVRPLGPVSVTIGEHVVVGAALGRLLLGLWKMLPVDAAGREHEWGLREFIAPVYDTALDLLLRFEAAVAEWRVELGVPAPNAIESEQERELLSSVREREAA